MSWRCPSIRAKIAARPGVIRQEVGDDNFQISFCSVGPLDQFKWNGSVPHGLNVSVDFLKGTWKYMTQKAKEGSKRLIPAVRQEFVFDFFKWPLECSKFFTYAN